MLLPATTEVLAARAYQPSRQSRFAHHSTLGEASVPSFRFQLLVAVTCLVQSVRHVPGQYRCFKKKSVHDPLLICGEVVDSMG